MTHPPKRLWNGAIYCTPFSSVTVETHEVCWQAPGHAGRCDFESCRVPDCEYDRNHSGPCSHRVAELRAAVAAHAAATRSPDGLWVREGGCWVASELAGRESRADQQQRMIEREHAYNGRFA